MTYAKQGLCNQTLDPYLWLEEVESERALAWVREQNAKSTSHFEANPHYKKVFEDTKAILFAKDRVPFSSFAYGYFYNFWQDAKNSHGLIRRTTYDSYKLAEPQWEIVLDLDQLSKAENENWVFQGATKIARKSTRRFLSLSRGGKDAAVTREFDYATKQFITDGFNLPEGKNDITGIDENLALVGTDFDKDEVTTSGYPRVIKIWRRGEPYAAAKSVFSVSKTDLSARAIRIDDGETRYLLVARAIDFYHTQYSFLNADQSLTPVPIPDTADLLSIKNGFLYFLVKRDGPGLRANTVMRIPVAAADLNGAQLVFAPAAGQSIKNVRVAADRIFVTILHNVTGRVLELKEQDGKFIIRELDFPKTGNLAFNYRDEDDETSFSTLTYSDPLTPQTQYRVYTEDGSYKLEALKSAPARFDSSGHEVVQNFATSKDGTRIPYFVIKPKNLKLDGSHPTILYGYGGFEVSATPYYSALIGKLWLEPGHVYAIANIRGGGEFGPAWHQAALKENRQRSFDDFAAVGEDLIARRITSKEHLGINGGSNGGLLTGTVMVQRPDILGAALIQVPLLDMLRYHRLLAGASWMGEYGDPDIPAEQEYLARYSPYQNVKADAKYPTPFFTTSTKDDRVHPGHARKMVARMIEQGHPVHYYENINGGHGGAANLEETAQMTALEYTYLWERLK